MTEKNHCYKNGLAERVNWILKDKYMLDCCFSNFKQAKQACAKAVKMYNTRRPHWVLNFKTPQEVHEAIVKKISFCCACRHSKRRKNDIKNEYEICKGNL